MPKYKHMYFVLIRSVFPGLVTNTDPLRGVDSQVKLGTLEAPKGGKHGTVEQNGQMKVLP